MPRGFPAGRSVEDMLRCETMRVLRAVGVLALVALLAACSTLREMGIGTAPEPQPEPLKPVMPDIEIPGAPSSR
jgi:hypothetical protein